MRVGSEWQQWGRKLNGRFFSAKAASCRSAYDDGTSQAASTGFSPAADVPKTTPFQTFSSGFQLPSRQRHSASDCTSASHTTMGVKAANTIREIVSKNITAVSETAQR